MYILCTRVLASLALLVRVAHCISWDIAAGAKNRLQFFNNGTLHSKHIPGANEITSVTYDAVRDRVLLAAEVGNMNMYIYSFDISTSKIRPVVTRISGDYIRGLAYDPVTELLFWMKGYHEIYSFLLTARSSKAVDGKLFVKLDSDCRGIAVYSWGGFIYWITNNEIERAAFDGSKREVLLHGSVWWRHSLVIDQQTQKMYWIEDTSHYNFSIKSSDLNGKNTRTFYYIGIDFIITSLAISKDFIYWWNEDQQAILQLQKCQQRGEGPIVYSNPSTNYLYDQLITAKYTINERTLGIQGCETLKNISSHSNDCKMDLSAKNYSTTCHNYCVHGNCSVSAEGQPKCSCYNGYSGLRCEVNTCHMYCLHDGVCSLNEVERPVCRCTGDYQGDRCDVSICKDFCMQGNCSVSTEGQPICRCNTGYSGARCEVSACHGYCLSNGDCSLSKNGEPVCECPAGFTGQRCEVATTQTNVCVSVEKMTQQILLEMKQVREDLQYTMQLYSDKLDESAIQIQICEESMKDNLQNLNETTTETQT